MVAFNTNGELAVPKGLKLSDRSEVCLWVPPVVVATGNGCSHDLINVVLHGGMPSLHLWKMQMDEGESSGE